MGRLIGEPIESYTPETYHAFAKSLIKTTPNTSKEVLGVSITQKGKKTTIRINKTDKSLMRDEVTKLAEEYKLSELELLKLLTKRKIGIFYGIDDQRAAEDKEAIKADAGDKKTTKRKNSSLDKLLKPERDTGMQEEVSIQPSLETTL